MFWSLIASSDHRDAESQVAIVAAPPLACPLPNQLIADLSPQAEQTSRKFTGPGPFSPALNFCSSHLRSQTLKTRTKKKKKNACMEEIRK